MLPPDQRPNIKGSTPDNASDFKIGETFDAKKILGNLYGPEAIFCDSYENGVATLRVRPEHMLPPLPLQIVRVINVGSIHEANAWVFLTPYYMQGHFRSMDASEIAEKGYELPKYLPGVEQIGAAVSLFEQLSSATIRRNLRVRLQTLSNVTFGHPMAPGEKMEIFLSFTKRMGRENIGSSTIQAGGKPTTMELSVAQQLASPSMGVEELPFHRVIEFAAQGVSLPYLDDSLALFSGIEKAFFNSDTPVVIGDVLQARAVSQSRDARYLRADIKISKNEEKFASLQGVTGRIVKAALLKKLFPPKSI